MAQPPAPPPSVKTFRLLIEREVSPPLQVHAISTSGTGYRSGDHTVLSPLITPSEGVWTLSTRSNDLLPAETLRLKAVPQPQSLDSVFCVLQLQQKSKTMTLQRVPQGVQHLKKVDEQFGTRDQVTPFIPSASSTNKLSVKERALLRNERREEVLEQGGGEADFRMDSDNDSERNEAVAHGTGYEEGEGVYQDGDEESPVGGGARKRGRE